jgi:hypothetical protein
VQSNSTVTSPVNGFVVERNYDAGSTPGDKPIVVVADLREMKLEAGVGEMEAGRLRVGMKATVAVQAKPGQTFTGQLAAIAPEVDERNRHFKIDLRVPNDGRALLSGMYATARIVEATVPNAILDSERSRWPAETASESSRRSREIRCRSSRSSRDSPMARACRSSKVLPPATPCSLTRVVSWRRDRKSAALISSQYSVASSQEIQHVDL